MTVFAIDDLTPVQRLDLIAELWDSLDSADVPLSAEQCSELDRRLEIADADPAAGKTWAAVLADLKRDPG
jgi:putative addiction module component (TIGR02574 family)